MSYRKSSFEQEGMTASGSFSGTFVGDGVGIVGGSSDTASYVAGANVDGIVALATSASDAAFDDIRDKPSLFSASIQVDHDATTNFEGTEHFLQSAITEVGTVVTGDVDAILPVGTLSASAQIKGQLDVTGITGSLLGTASWADDAVTASFALNAGGGDFLPLAGGILTGDLKMDADVIVRSGSLLRLQDAGNTDLATFRHDGTDFLLTLTNTTDYNITGLTSLQLGGHLNIDATGGILSFTQTSDERTRISMLGVGGDGGTMRFFTRPDSGAITEIMQITSNAIVSIRTGKRLQMFDAAEDSYALWQHDGTDFNLDLVATTDYNITGLSGSLKIDGVAVLTAGSFVAISGDTMTGQLLISESRPRITFLEDGAPVDEGRWTFDYDGGSFAFTAVNDAVDTAANIFTVTRTGTTVDIVNFQPTNLQHGGTDVSLDGHTHPVSEISDFDPTNYLPLGGGTLTGSLIMANTIDILPATNTGTDLGSDTFKFGAAHIRIMHAGDNNPGSGFFTIGTNNSGSQNMATYKSAAPNLTNMQQWIDDSVGSFRYTLSYSGGADEYFQWITNSAERIRINNVGLEVMSGSALTVRDSTNSDSASFSHDGTDFNTIFNNTTDWNITDLPNIKVNRRAALTTTIQIGEPSVARGDSQHGSLILYGENPSGDIGSFTITHGGSNVSVGFGGATTPALQLNINVDVLGDKWLQVRDGTNADRGRWTHDGTDFNLDCTNTTDYNITGITNLNVGGTAVSLVGHTHVVANITDFDPTDYLLLAGGTLTGDLVMADGGIFSIQDAGNTDSASFSHDGTDFRIEFNNTGVVRMIGHTGDFLVFGNGIRILNNREYKGRNQADSLDFGLIKLNTTDIVELDPDTQGLTMPAASQIGFQNFTKLQIAVGPSGSRWFRVGEINASGGRGTGRFHIAAQGGNITPFNLIFHVTKDWLGQAGINIIHAAGGVGEISSIRLAHNTGSNFCAVDVEINSDSEAGFLSTIYRDTAMNAAGAYVFTSVNWIDQGVGDPAGSTTESVLIEIPITNNLMMAASTDLGQSFLVTDQLSFNRGANNNSDIVLGEESVLRGDSQDSRIQMWAENAGAINNVLLDMRGANLLLTSDHASFTFQVQTDMEVLAGHFLRVRDSTNNDRATWTHDGTDFNLAFTNTTDYNITGLTNLNVGGTAVSLVGHTHVVANITDFDPTDYLLLTGGTLSGDLTIKVEADAVTTLRIGENTILRGNSQDGRIIFYGENASVIGGMIVNHTGTNLQFTSTAGATNIQFIPNDRVEVLSGKQFRMRDSTEADIATWQHDGTDFNLTLTNTTDYNITGLTQIYLGGDLFLDPDGAGNPGTAHLRISADANGATDVPMIRARIVGATKNPLFAIDLNEDFPAVVLTASGATGGTNLHFNIFGAVRYKMTPDYFLVGNGEALRVSNTAENDWGQWSHDGTDFNLAFTNTTDYNITGLSVLKVNADLRVTGLLVTSGSNARHRFIDADAAVDETTWEIFTNQEEMRFRLLNDALSTGVNWLTVTRTANTANIVNFLCDNLKHNSVDVALVKMTTNGDILYYNSGRQRLAKGSDDEVLTLVSGIPAWAAAGSGIANTISTSAPSGGGSTGDIWCRI